MSPFDKTSYQKDYMRQYREQLKEKAKADFRKEMATFAESEIIKHVAEVELFFYKRIAGLFLESSLSAFTIKDLQPEVEKMLKSIPVSVQVIRDTFMANLNAKIAESEPILDAQFDVIFDQVLKEAQEKYSDLELQAKIMDASQEVSKQIQETTIPRIIEQMPTFPFNHGVV